MHSSGKLVGEFLCGVRSRLFMMLAHSSAIARSIPRPRAESLPIYFPETSTRSRTGRGAIASIASIKELILYPELISVSEWRF